MRVSLPRDSRATAEWVIWKSNEHQIRTKRHILPPDAEIACFNNCRISIGADAPVIISLSRSPLPQMDRDFSGIIYCDFRFEKYGFTFAQGHERYGARPQ